MILKDRFQGKTAIVTGGASGIARKISERFVAEGGRIAVFDVQEEAEKALCHNLGDDLARALALTLLMITLLAIPSQKERHCL